MNFCMHCGTVLRAEAIRCPACGTAVEHFPGDEARPARPQIDESQVPVIHSGTASRGSTAPSSTPPSRPIDSVPIPADERTIVRPRLPEYLGYPSPTPTDSSATTKPSRRWIVPLVIGVAVVLLAGGGVAAWLVVSSKPKATLYHLEAMDEITESAFTSSMVTTLGKDPGHLPTDLDAPEPTGASDGRLQVRQVAGDRPKLYATVDANTDDSQKTPRVCDKDQLRSALQGSEVETVWQRSLGESKSVRVILDTFTPVLLGQDTLVTEVDYSPDGGEPYQAILQAGTAVLIDKKAQPRVRCATGNPLREPELAPNTLKKGSLTGSKWSTFSPSQVVAITSPQTTPVTALDEVYDIVTGSTVRIRTDRPGD